MRPARVRRALIAAGAVACAVAALALALLAVETVRARDALTAGDRRYATAPDDAGLWRPGALGAPSVSRPVLGLDDDLDYRRAVRAMRLSQRDAPTNSDVDVILRRVQAQRLLQQVAKSDPDPRRRSRAMNLLGVLVLSTPAANREERVTMQQVALGALQKAIQLDPGNDKAKFNLEVLLRRRAGVQNVQGGPTPNPSAGQGSSRGAATGPPGKGY
jgi:hypothetical protein